MKSLACLAALSAVLTATGARAGTAGEPGEALYASRCGGCHSLDPNRTGPRHRALFGRLAGSVPGYDYSPALARAGFVWDAAMLDRWLADPEKLVPGQRMNYSVPSKEERARIIEYLREQR